MVTTSEPGPRGRQGGRESVSTDDAERTTRDEIRGSLTLADVEQLTGLPVAVLVRELGLPAEVSPTENLGRLRRQHGFEISDVRQIIEEQLRKE